MQNSSFPFLQQAAHEAHLASEVPPDSSPLSVLLRRAFYGRLMPRECIQGSLWGSWCTASSSSAHYFLWSEQWFSIKPVLEHLQLIQVLEGEWPKATEKTKILYSCSNGIYSHYTNSDSRTKSWKLLLLVNVNSPSKADLLWLFWDSTYTRQVAKHLANLENIYIFFPNKLFLVVLLESIPIPSVQTVAIFTAPSLFLKRKWMWIWEMKHQWTRNRLLWKMTKENLYKQSYWF